MLAEIRNKVQESALVLVDLEDFYPTKEIVFFDIVPLLFGGFVLKEKDFLAQLNALEPTIWRDKIIGIFCSNEAVVPVWAYLLLQTRLQSFQSLVFFAQNVEEILIFYFQYYFQNFDFSIYQNQKVIVKGCGKKTLPLAIYFDFMQKIIPFTSSLRMGQACANYLIFKKK